MSSQHRGEAFSQSLKRASSFALRLRLDSDDDATFDASREEVVQIRQRLLDAGITARRPSSFKMLRACFDGSSADIQEDSRPLMSSSPRSSSAGRSDGLFPAFVADRKDPPPAASRGDKESAATIAARFVAVRQKEASAAVAGATKRSLDREKQRREQQQKQRQEENHHHQRRRRSQTSIPSSAAAVRVEEEEGDDREEEDPLMTISCDASASPYAVLLGLKREDQEVGPRVT